MAYRNIVIESPASISLRNSQLIIRTDREHSVAVEDISALLIENRQSNITSAALSRLGQGGCAVFVCDERHMPCAVALPYAQHSRHLSVVRAQLAMPEPLKKQLWKSIVVAKIRNQSACLRLMGHEAEASHLLALSGRVRSGDADNTEATAAMKYFPALFYPGFSRGADNGFNAALNYGYAILRGALARQIAVYGFLPAFGLHHCSELNAFNLADDLIEPFRPLVDLLTATAFERDTPLSPENKRLLFNCLNLDLLSGAQRHSAAYAMERLVKSLSRSILDSEPRLILPELVELKQHSYE